MRSIPLIAAAALLLPALATPTAHAGDSFFSISFGSGYHSGFGHRSYSTCPPRFRSHTYTPFRHGYFGHRSFHRGFGYSPYRYGYSRGYRSGYRDSFRPGGITLNFGDRHYESRRAHPGRRHHHRGNRHHHRGHRNDRHHRGNRRHHR